MRNGEYITLPANIRTVYRFLADGYRRTNKTKRCVNKICKYYFELIFNVGIILLNCAYIIIE